MRSLYGITGVPCSLCTLDGRQVITTGGQSTCTASCGSCPGGAVPSCCMDDGLQGLKGGESVMVTCRGGLRMIAATVSLEGRPVAFFCSGPLSSPEDEGLDTPDSGEKKTPTSSVISSEKDTKIFALASTFAGMLSMCITHSFQLIREMEGRKLAENRLHHSEGLYRAIFEHSGTAMAIVRTDGSIVQANIEFGNLIRIDQDVLCGIPWTVFVSSEERKRIMDIHEKRDLNRLFSMNGSEITLSSPDGQEVSAVLHTGKIPGSDRYVLSLLDVTERHRLEEMREEAFVQIERNFTQLAVLNDRIRNPLTAIVGLAEMAEGPFSREVLKHAREIDDLVTNLDRCWLESEAVRSFLRKHYGTEEKGSVSAAQGDTKKIL